MEVIVNDYRGRSPQHAIDAMIHDASDPCDTVPPQRDRGVWWRFYLSRENAETAIGERTYTCQICFPGQGRILDR